MPIKILVASTNGIIRDGITEWMIQYFSVMDKSDLEVHSLSWEKGQGDQLARVAAAGITVHEVPSRRDFTVAYYKELKKILAQGFDVLHVCGNSASMVMELLAAKSTVVDMRVAHVRNTTCTHRVADALLRPLFYSLATDYYACGREAGRWLYRGRKFVVLPNGKVPSHYAFSEGSRWQYRESLGLGTEGVAIGHVGYFNEQKNHRFVLMVFAAILKNNPGSRLFLIGEGEKMPEVEALARELDISSSVVFLGRRPDVPRLLNAMDCMVLPSLYEGFPNVVVEWQYNGLPCVISDTITEECAITPLVERMPLERSPEEWAATVKRKLVASDRARDSALATDALRAAGFDVNENAKMLKHLYIEGLERNRG